MVSQSDAFFSYTPIPLSGDFLMFSCMVIVKKLIWPPQTPHKEGHAIHSPRFSKIHYSIGGIENAGLYSIVDMEGILFGFVMQHRPSPKGEGKRMRSKRKLSANAEQRTER
jgi:hypothetical protein